MKLMLVRGNDADGENQDLFVVARDATQAIDLWNDQCLAEGWPRDDAEDGEETSPRTRTVDPANIRLILEDVAGTAYAGAARAIGWADLPVVMEV